MKYERNSEAYFIENGLKVTKVTITQYSGGFYTIRFPNGGAMRVRENRLFNSINSATEYLEKNNPNAIKKLNNEFMSRNAQLL